MPAVKKKDAWSLVLISTYALASNSDAEDVEIMVFTNTLKSLNNTDTI